ncbi:hypothetical protein B484DRAFT_437814, partial [Ochromonadaceae sp. CCMP2298]
AFGHTTILVLLARRTIRRHSFRPGCCRPALSMLGRHLSTGASRPTPWLSSASKTEWLVLSDTFCPPEVRRQGLAMMAAMGNAEDTDSDAPAAKRPKASEEEQVWESEEYDINTRGGVFGEEKEGYKPSVLPTAPVEETLEETMEEMVVEPLAERVQERDRQRKMTVL